MNRSTVKLSKFQNKAHLRQKRQIAQLKLLKEKGEAINKMCCVLKKSNTE